MAKPVLSIWSTSVRLMTTLRLSDNSFSTPWRNVMVSHPVTSRPMHRRMTTSSQKCVLVLEPQTYSSEKKPSDLKAFKAKARQRNYLLGVAR